MGVWVSGCKPCEDVGVADLLRGWERMDRWVYSRKVYHECNQESVHARLCVCVCVVMREMCVLVCEAKR